MLQLEPVIVARLEAALSAGWVVKGDATSTGERKPAPDGGVAIISLGGSAATTPKGTAAQIAPAWSVVLAARKGPAAPAQLDAGMESAIASLHNWKPGEVAGRRWEPLVLVQVVVPPLQDDGITGIELTFTTSGLFKGQS